MDGTVTEASGDYKRRLAKANAGGRRHASRYG